MQPDGAWPWCDGCKSCHHPNNSACALVANMLVFTASTWNYKPLSVDGLRIKNGKVQLHYVGDRKWYDQKGPNDRAIIVKGAL